MLMAEWSATSMSRKINTAMATTAVSIIISRVPLGILGKTRFNSRASRSVPPVLMPRRNSIPMPSPMTTPPQQAASRGLLV